MSNTNSLTTGVYEGKAKRIVPRSANEVAIIYKDDATAFNGQKHSQFAGKGVLNSQITERLFLFLEASGIRTHHLGRLDENTLLAKPAKILPIEVVVRFLVAGSLQKRTDLPENSVCEPPIVEFYYKRDDLGDPIINEDHIRLLNAATAEEVQLLRREALAIGLKLKQLFALAEIDLVDMKLEFGRTNDGVVLCDEISPDTCRFRDHSTGNILDKDRFRHDLGDLLGGYREVLARLDSALLKSTPVIGAKS
ncbi:MAG: phosphoribosylaminoimidazolesuccinocarboxamide synthase [Deltaproteobacteria bacterium]|nr:phosphoribosylaminoimidazolesuccinocarboxamide synthase [Deltaproteobacteria bacterium]